MKAISKTPLFFNVCTFPVLNFLNRFLFELFQRFVERFLSRTRRLTTERIEKVNKELLLK